MAAYEAYELAEELLKEGRIKRPEVIVPSVLKSNTITWLVDAGAGRHVIGRGYLTEEQAASIQKVGAVRFQTANGNGITVIEQFSQSCN